jgi:hypothetical protein
MEDNQLRNFADKLTLDSLSAQNSNRLRGSFSANILL